MVSAADHDPLLQAQLNRGLDINQQIGLAPPPTLEDQERQSARAHQRYEAAYAKYEAEINAYNNMDPDERARRQARGDWGPARPKREDFGLPG